MGRAEQERSDGADDAVLHQAVFREINEQIEGLGDNFRHDGMLVVLCECTSSDCVERLTITEGDYEAVRRFPTRFLVKAGHDNADAERVVQTNHNHVVVEKLGPAGSAAIRLDPRSQAQAPPRLSA